MDMFTLMSGLQLTCIYGILAIGVSIIWSSLGMLNLAHGFTFAVSGYGAWWAATTLGNSGWIVLGAGVATGGLVGLCIYFVAFLLLVRLVSYFILALIITRRCT